MNTYPITCGKCHADITNLIYGGLGITLKCEPSGNIFTHYAYGVVHDCRKVNA